MAAGLTIVVVAALADGPSDATSGDASAADAPAGVPTLVVEAVTEPDEARAGVQTSTPPQRPMPASLSCHDLDRSACRLAVATALGALQGDLPSVDSAEAWSGLVCGAALDCPPTSLDSRATPLANVVLRLRGGGPAAWINVVYRSHGRPLDFDPTVEAWIERWGSSLRSASADPRRPAR
jgi:hypothetical protein